MGWLRAFLLITGAPFDVTVDHNTIFHEGMTVLVDEGASPGFEFTDNVAPHNTFGIFGSGAGIGGAALDAYFPGAVVRRNALGGGPASQYPSDNLFPDMATFTSQFVNAAASDFRLVSGSMFRGAGTDGRDLGVDFAVLEAAFQSGVTGGDAGQPDPGSGDLGDIPGGGGGGTPAPYGGTPAGLPGVIQAEDFDEGGQGVGYSDASPGNSGGQYRATGVDLEATLDTGGGFNVGWAGAGEWLHYTVTVAAAGTYDIEVRVASLGAGGTFHIEVNGVDKTGPLMVADTGGWQAWTTVRRQGVTLSAGQQVWRVVMAANGVTGAVGNFNWVRVVAASGGAAEGSIPFMGTPVALPGTIEAENFDDGGAGLAYLDSTPGNSGGQYRATDVDIEATTDAGGGYNIGWMSAGEWLNYTLSIAGAGTYDIHVRVASNGSGGSFHIEVDGVDRTGPLVIPDTGSWQSWTTVSRTGVSLNGGQQVWRVVMDTDGATGFTGNINYVRVLSASTPPVTGFGDLVLYASDVTTVSGNWARVGSWSGAGGEKMQSSDWGWASTSEPLAHRSIASRPNSCRSRTAPIACGCGFARAATRSTTIRCGCSGPARWMPVVHRYGVSEPGVRCW